MRTNLVGYLTSQTDRLIGGFLLSGANFGRYSLALLVSRAFYESSGHAIINFYRTSTKTKSDSWRKQFTNKIFIILMNLPLICFAINLLIVVPLFVYLTNTSSYSMIIPILGFTYPLVIAAWLTKSFWFVDGNLKEYQRFSSQFLIIALFCCLGFLHSPQLALYLFVLKDLLLFLFNYLSFRKYVPVRVMRGISVQVFLCSLVLGLDFEMFDLIWWVTLFLLIVFITKLARFIQKNSTI